MPSERSQLEGVSPTPKPIPAKGTTSSDRVEIKHTEDVDASVEALWALVADFNNVQHWHPDVVDSRIEKGSGRVPGAIREIHLRDGTRVRERLVSISDAEHRYTYSVIESPLPIRDHSSTLRFETVPKWGHSDNLVCVVYGH